MSLRQLFLCHYHQDAAEIQELATDLRLRGIVPWVDKDGGFIVGDHAKDEARRAIREDCFGLLLYATRSVFTRTFIRDVEIPEALEKRKRDPAFMLFAVPRRITFSTMAALSAQHFGQDLTEFHSVRIPVRAELQTACRKIADDLLSKVLDATSVSSRGDLHLQVSTRDLFPDGRDVLRVDARSLFRERVDDAIAWQRLTRALIDIKERIAPIYGRPRLHLGGSKHLTAAFLIGRIFAPFTFDIRQTPLDVWSTDVVASQPPLQVNIRQCLTGTGRLFVEFASRDKDVPIGVDTFITTNSIQPEVRLQLRPHVTGFTMDAASCRAAADQAYAAIEDVTRSRRLTEVHLFAAAPQSFMIMLGRLFKGMPPVVLYEWTGTTYVQSCVVGGGVL